MHPGWLVFVHFVQEVCVPVVSALVGNHSSYHSIVRDIASCVSSSDYCRCLLHKTINTSRRADFARPSCTKLGYIPSYNCLYDIIIWVCLDHPYLYSLPTLIIMFLIHHLAENDHATIELY